MWGSLSQAGSTVTVMTESVVALHTGTLPLRERLIPGCVTQIKIPLEIPRGYSSSCFPAMLQERAQGGSGGSGAFLTRGVFCSVWQ